MKIPTRHNMKIGGPPVRMRLLASLVIALLASLPITASAVDVTGTSRSYLTSREQADRTKLLPGYEYLNFGIQDLGSDSISAHFGGWAGYDFKEKTGDNDLQYGYLSYRAKTSNALVNVGRVTVFEGAAAERLDGIYARTDLQANLGISAFGGNPVETGNPVDAAAVSSGNNSIYGGRLTHKVPGLYILGVSYLKEERIGADYRKEEGIDLWLHPMDKVDLSGRSNYNATTKEWKENTYNLVLGPFNKLRLTTEASWINYKDYFFGTTLSAFTFQPGILDPNEKVRTLGENVAYAITDKLSIGVDYKAFDYEIAGNAKSYGAALKYGDVQGGAGLSARKMDGDANRLQYMEYRIYGYKKINKIDLALDLLDVKYDQSINGITNSYSASIAAQYALMQDLKVGADVEYQKNPDFNKDLRVFAKLIYNFDIGSGRASSPASAQHQHTVPPAASQAAQPAEKAPGNAQAQPAGAMGKPVAAGTRTDGAGSGSTKEVKP